MLIDLNNINKVVTDGTQISAIIQNGNILWLAPEDLKYYSESIPAGTETYNSIESYACIPWWK